MSKEEEHHFEVSIDWKEGHEGDLKVQGKSTLPLSSPPIWGGHSDRFSPQELFVASVAGCYMTTFSEFAHRMDLTIKSLQIRGRGTVQRHPQGGWHFTNMHIQMDITTPDEKSALKVQRAVQLAHKYCMVSRSLKCQVDVEHHITTK